MIDIAAEVQEVRTNSWGAYVRTSIADGLEKLAAGAADAGTVALTQTKAEEAYSVATSAKTDAQTANDKADILKIDVENLKDKSVLLGSITVYVNNETGSDTNTGTTSGTAFQTLDKALQVAKQYQMAIIRLTAGQTFTASETVPGIGIGVILWDNNIDFRSTSNTVQAIIDANVCALRGTGTFIGVQINGFFTATRSDITLSSCKAGDLMVSDGTKVFMKNCELTSVSCDFSDMRMAGCTVGSASADNCSMVYTDSSTIIANKTTDNGGMFYRNGIPEAQ